MLNRCYEGFLLLLLSVLLAQKLKLSQSLVKQNGDRVVHCLHSWFIHLWLIFLISHRFLIAFLYSAILRSRTDLLCSHVTLHEWITLCCVLILFLPLACRQRYMTLCCVLILFLPLVCRQRYMTLCCVLMLFLPLVCSGMYSFHGLHWSWSVFTLIFFQSSPYFLLPWCNHCWLGVKKRRVHLHFFQILTLVLIALM